MDGDEGDLVVGEATDHLEDVLGVFGGEAGGGFVEEVDVGDADHVHGGVEAASLSSGKGFGFVVAGEAVADFVEAEFDEFGIDAAAALANGEVGCAYGGGGVEVFFDGEEGIECLVLGDEGDVGGEVFVFGIEVDSVEVDATLAGFDLAAEGFEKG